MSDFPPVRFPREPENIGHAPSDVPAGAQAAKLTDRFLARLIDQAVIGVVAGVILAVFLYGAIFQLIPAVSLLLIVLGWVASAAVFLGYYGFMESRQGTTLGKMVMKLRVEGPSGRQPTLAEAIRRNLWTGFLVLDVVPYLGTSFFVLPILGSLGPLVAIIMMAMMILIAVGIHNDTVNRQGWHDRFAGGTRVLKNL